jgi:uncharacterized membrane protein
MPGYSVFVFSHIAAGAVALLTFWLNAALRKGSTPHRRVGRAYLIAMAAVVVSGMPLVVQRMLDGRPVTAAFLGYLLLLTATAAWSLWRAVRDRHDPRRYTGGAYRAFAIANLLAGAGVLALGLNVGAPLLIGFSTVGLFTGQDMLRKRATLAQRPLWWREEHYTAMLACGVATHIAFLSIGLPRLLPSVDGTVLHYLAWFGPLLVAVIAKLWLDRRYRRPLARQLATPGKAATAS